MHRTQLLIEQWQYEALRGRAEREGRSLSALVRDILESSLTPSHPSARKGICVMDGIGEDAAAHGEHHDKYLYVDEHRAR